MFTIPGNHEWEQKAKFKKIVDKCQVKKSCFKFVGVEPPETGLFLQESSNEISNKKCGRNKPADKDKFHA